MPFSWHNIPKFTIITIIKTVIFITIKFSVSILSYYLDYCTALSITTIYLDRSILSPSNISIGITNYIYGQGYNYTDMQVTGLRLNMLKCYLPGGLEKLPFQLLAL